MSELMASVNYRQFVTTLQRLENATRPQVEWSLDQLKQAVEVINKMKSEITECVNLLVKAHGQHYSLDELIDHAIRYDRLQETGD
jgi:hypothetical protein